MGNDGISSLFCDIIQDYFLYQLVSEPTCDENILDLVITSAPELISCVAISEQIY